MTIRESAVELLLIPLLVNSLDESVSNKLLSLELDSCDTCVDCNIATKRLDETVETVWGNRAGNPRVASRPVESADGCDDCDFCDYFTETEKRARTRQSVKGQNSNISGGRRGKIRHDKSANKN